MPNRKIKDDKVKRCKLTKAQRRQVYELMNGHCAYCGDKISIDTMCVDHVVALHRGGTDTLDNMFPACRPCNHRKDTLTVEGFRHELMAAPRRLLRDNTTYKNAVRFGLVIPNEHRIQFYFEVYDGLEE